MKAFDVVVIGGGPAGLAAGLEANNNGVKTLIIEREGRLGGILKQCIHDGFGVIKFKEKLTGPEYAEKYLKMVKDKKIDILTSTFVNDIEKKEDGFIITLVNGEDGVFKIKCKALILANGCRERTSKQIFIHGSRPSGVYTAGTAQYFVNILGYLPCKKCVILGSGDIGLIMARRLTLEGATVEGVYEVKNNPSGLTRNIVQCLNDYNIPLYLSHTITKIIGDDRVEAVEISEVNKDMRPIKGTERIVECDGVILSVGLIPENEIAESLNIKINKNTKGPYVDNNFMTLEDGVFSCGNALHVNDLVDFVSESGEIAGKEAATFVKERNKDNRVLIPINKSDDFLYVVPQYLDMSADDKAIIYFRSKDNLTNETVEILVDNKVIFSKRFRFLKPPEMERVEIDFSNIKIEKSSEIILKLKEL